jgi:hypothetical protein
MANRSLIVLTAAMTALCFIPTAVHAGAGGSPAAPGAAAAGNTAQYCCTTLTDAVVGDGKSSVPVISGTGCTSINDTAADRQSCTAKAIRCRGEIYSSSAATLTRCFSP